MTRYWRLWLCVASGLLCLMLVTGAQAGTGGAPGANGDGGVRSSDEMPIIRGLSPTDVVRGSPVTVTGTGFGTDKEAVSLSLGDQPIGHPTAMRKDGSGFTFIVPATIGDPPRPVALGKALLRVSVGGKWQISRMAADPFDKGRLHVHADSTSAVKLTGVVPHVATEKAFTKLTLLGDGLPESGRDLALLVDGREVPLCFDDARRCGVRATTTAHELVLADPYASDLVRLLGTGQHKLALRVGEAEPTSTVDITISKYEAHQIREWAAAVVGLILSVAVALLVAGGSYNAGRLRLVWRAFLLDTETESFSLAKAQSFAWGIAVVLAYAYLLLSRFLVQGAFELPDVPEGLPSIIGISAATTAGSVGITAARGPKGAGTANPSFSDLISVGGVVSPERFMFLLWTSVAIGAFLGAVFQTNPFDIDKLPALPPNLLALSGVSAAGYLGGKLVRGPGPVLSDVVVDQGSLVLTLVGRNLDRFARFEINGQPITKLLPAKASDGTPYRPRLLEPEGGDRGNDFGKSLELKLVEPDPNWRAAQQPRLELAIINSDGQRAAYALEIAPKVWKAFVAPSATDAPGPQQPPDPQTEPGAS